MEIFNIIWSLRPVDMSIVMFVVMIFDLWSALNLSVKKHSFVSKSFFRGLLYNLIVIFVPFILKIVVMHGTDNLGKVPEFDYVQALSLVITFLFVAGTVSSIIANYTAAYPDAGNWVTKFGYRFLPAEIKAKLEKHENQ